MGANAQLIFGSGGKMRLRVDPPSIPDITTCMTHRQKHDHTGTPKLLQLRLLYLLLRLPELRLPLASSDLCIEFFFIFLSCVSAYFALFSFTYCVTWLLNCCVAPR